MEKEFNAYIIYTSVIITHHLLCLGEKSFEIPYKFSYLFDTILEN